MRVYATQGDTCPRYVKYGITPLPMLSVTGFRDIESYLDGKRKGGPRSRRYVVFAPPVEQLANTNIVKIAEIWNRLFHIFIK